ncbi:hypothetical protein [Trichodesmium erythraeum]|uniref:hypothetical protein n=1 Tax=Trichodesmium erythraeum TaxID=1206 RepID=UPI0012DC99B3|nr:hypothetical protein [Trichodesmium erythraeum GBRTRLIN201]
MVLDLTGYICISRLAVSPLLLWEIKEGSDRAPHSHSKHSIVGIFASLLNMKYFFYEIK